jgi:hypothetical protein
MTALSRTTSAVKGFLSKLAATATIAGGLLLAFSELILVALAITLIAGSILFALQYAIGVLSSVRAAI